MLAGIFPIGPDREGILFYQAFYFWRGFPIVKAQEIMAGLVCSGVIHLKLVFPASAADNHMPCNDRTEVIQKKPRPYFHFNVLTFLGMKIYGSNHVLEFPEGGFNPPSEMIKEHHFINRKFFRRQICNNVLIVIL